MESSLEIMYESLEDVTKLSEIVIFHIFLPVNKRVAFLDSSVENQKGGYIKLKGNISLNTFFHEWHLVSFRVPIVSPFHCILHTATLIEF